VIDSPAGLPRVVMPKPEARSDWIVSSVSPDVLSMNNVWTAPDVRSQQSGRFHASRIGSGFSPELASAVPRWPDQTSGLSTCANPRHSEHHSAV
jgi:hypothetical protein